MTPDTFSVTAWNRQDGNKNQTWGLSLVGDWNTHTDAGVTQTRTHGPAHEFTSVTISGNNHALSYDPKGNMLTRPAALSAPALNLLWDFENQLKGADIDGTPASLEVTFEFDALGRRVARNEGSSQIVFVQASQQTIADYPRGTSSASPTYRYVYASYIDEPILRHAGTLATLPTTGSDAIYFHRNQQYSITALTDAAGTLVERYAYTGYGAMSIFAPNGTTRANSNYANRYTYTGREWDVSLALDYFRSRWLDGLFGRFLCRDPDNYVDGSSLYFAYFALYCTDPTGNSVVPPVVIAAAFALLACLERNFKHGLNKYPHDEFMRHCWTSCSAGRWCGVELAALAGFGFELATRAMEIVAGQDPNWRDFEFDMFNNHRGLVCAWGGRGAAGHGFWLGVWLVSGKGYCECCCKRF